MTTSPRSPWTKATGAGGQRRRLAALLRGDRWCTSAVSQTAFVVSLSTVASLTIVACSNSAPSTPPAATTPAEATATPGGTAASPDLGASPPTEPSATPSAASSEGASVAAPCAKDSDCAWDDPCLPKRCVAAASAPPPTGCDKSVPPEGTCVCFDRQCAYRPDARRSPVSVEAACTSPPACVMDVAAGTCAPGDDPDVRPPGRPGPRCRCDSNEPRRCHYVWVDPVPCASDDDCWVSDAGSPIARPRKVRGKRFRPCKDGANVPACDSGTCILRGASC
jgi:hypothetical protein